MVLGTLMHKSNLSVDSYSGIYFIAKDVQGKNTVARQGHMSTSVMTRKKRGEKQKGFIDDNDNAISEGNAGEYS